MKITVIGCGNAGLIHAAKMFEKGFKVGILKTSNAIHNDFFSLITKENGYNVKDETNGGNRFWVKPEFITKDVKKAVEFGDVLFITTTTLQHEDVARMISPYVRDNQIIVLVPGYMGSLIFRKHIKKNIIYSEWETTAYNGRIIDSLFVRISFYNPRNAISVYPLKEKEYILNMFGEIFENTKYTRKHILESAIHNPNLIVHPMGVLFSSARIENSKGEFWMYKEAFTESVIRSIYAFDEQKNALLNKFGCDSLNYFDAAKWRNEVDLTIDSLQVFKSFAESSNKGPSSLVNRYLLEDVPMGLCLFSSLGKIAGVPTTIADSIITLSSALLGKDLSKNGRTAAYLFGKENLNIDYILDSII